MKTNESTTLKIRPQRQSVYMIEDYTGIPYRDIFSRKERESDFKLLAEIYANEIGLRQAAPKRFKPVYVLNKYPIHDTYSDDRTKQPILRYYIATCPHCKNELVFSTTYLFRTVLKCANDNKKHFGCGNKIAIVTFGCTYQMDMAYTYAFKETGGDNE